MISKTVAYCLWLFPAFVGILGVHRFYLGRPVSAIVQIFTFGLCGVWWLIDIFLIPDMVRQANLKSNFITSNGNTNTNTNVIHVHVNGANASTSDRPPPPPSV